MPDADAGDGSVDPDGGPPTVYDFKVTPAAMFQTGENGQQTTFKIALTAAPSDNVTLAFSSDDESEGKVAPTQVTFTKDSWNADLTVTITGQNDDERDGNREYNIVFAAATSTDTRYAGKKPNNLRVTNVDDDTAGITLIDATDVRVNENGGEDKFSVRLNTAPAANTSVTIALVSSATDEVTVAPAAVTFNAMNWNAPREIVVKGVDDNEADGPQMATIATTVTSDDPLYNNLEVADVAVTNEDNDTAGFRVQPTMGLVTNEQGRQASFTVALATQPSTGTVTIPVSSSATDEATVSVTSLVFTRDNWNAPQRVLVTGVNDALEDKSQPFTIVLAPATSSDPRYMNLDPPDVTGTNFDDDTAGYTLNGAEGLTVSEAGGQVSFTVVLNHAPTASVTIPLSSSDATEATVAPASLVFTTSNWAAPQTVTVTGVDDTEPDGAQMVNIVLADPVSDDAEYGELTGQNVPVTVTDNESAGITVVTSQPFETNESGTQTSFSIVLNSRPSANVTIPVSSSDTTEIGVAPSSVTFTPANWNAPQTVTLTGVDDNIVDGNQPVNIVIAPATSTDAAYAMRDAPDLVAVNVDNDSAGATVTPTFGLETSESGAQATFTVRLNTKPSGDVTIGVSAPDATEGVVSPASLVFTGDNWNAPQTVTVTGVDDDVADGAQEFQVVFAAATSADTRYTGLTLPNVIVVNNDNDTPGVEFLDAENLTTTEAPGGTATFRIRLRSQPTGDVTVAVLSSNVAEGVAAPASLTFTPVNWNAAQNVIVTGVNDEIADGAQTYQITFALTSAADSRYNGLPVGNVQVTNIDNDTAGVTVVPSTTPLSVDESGTQTTFTVRLNSQPTQPVTIPIGSSNQLEGTVSPASLTFDAQDWNSVKTVTITGVGDLRQDGNQEFQVVFGAITGGANYAAITVPSLTVTNYDTDSAGILVEQTAPLVTREDGTQTSFRVRLARPPTANVTLPIFVIENDEARVITAQPLTFTNLNSGAWVNVTIQGWDDFVADGEQPFRVQVGPAESTDVSYAGRTIPFLTGTNGDDDSPGVIVTPTSGLSVSEAGGPGSTASFDVRLTSQPIGTVTIPIQVLDPAQVTANRSSLTFDASDWSGVKTVTVSPVDDAIADDTQPFSIALGPTTTSGMDPNYVGIVIPNVTGTATDNDTPGLETLPNVFALPAPELATDESGIGANFQVRLTSQPTAPVTITATSTRPGEGTVSPASVIVQPADWNVYQTFTVTGVDDDVDDGAQQYAIQIAASSTDPNYNRAVPNLQARNTDNDTVGITLSAATLPPTSESGAPSQTFTLRLNSQPTADVIIDLASSDLGEIAINTNRLTFTAANWNVAQSVTVAGVDEFIDDGNQLERVNIAPALSADTLYNGLTVTTPAVTYVEIRNDDDDIAGIQLPDDSVTVYDQLSSDTFTVRLNSQPLGDVTIPLTVDDPSEVTLSTNSLTFTPANWNTFQTVTVTGVEDGVRDFDASFQIHLGPATAASDLPYAGFVGNSVNVLAVDGGTSCRTIKAAGPALGDGMYVLDPDLQGPIARFNAWCDMTTARAGVTGGWTLVSWSRNTDTLGGVPYPGLLPCGAANFNSCNRGSGVPTAALDGLFDISTELAQGQTITETAVMMLATPFVRLGQYEFAGSYVYPSLADLTIGTGATTCSVLATGEFRTIAGPNTNEGTPVFLNQSLASGLAGADPATLLDYSGGNMAYRYSLGGRSNTCAVNGTPPTSYLGTWQDTQYGPDQQNAAGAYSVWVR